MKKLYVLTVLALCAAVSVEAGKCRGGRCGMNPLAKPVKKKPVVKKVQPVQPVQPAKAAVAKLAPTAKWKPTVAARQVEKPGSSYVKATAWIAAQIQQRNDAIAKFKGELITCEEALKSVKTEKDKEALLQQIAEIKKNLEALEQCLQ